MRRILKPLALIALFLGVVTTSFYSAQNIGIFKIQKVDVNFSSETESNEYFSGLLENLRPFLNRAVGQNIWSIELPAVENFLFQQNWIEKVSISRRLPRGLSIEITPRKLVSVVLKNSSTLIPISSEANLLPETSVRNYSNLPILRGKKFGSDRELRKKALQILSELPEEGRLSRTSISEMELDTNNEIWLSVIKSGIRIHLGVTNVPVKAARVAKVMDYLETNDVKGRVIDADFSKKVVVRLRNSR